MSVFDTYTLTDTIANGTALGSGVNVNGCHPIRLIMPAGWDAAAITLQESPDGAAWQNLYDTAGAEVSFTVAAARTVIIQPSVLPGIQWLRVRSGTSGTPVNQTAARTMTWLVKKYGGSN